MIIVNEAKGEDGKGARNQGVKLTIWYHTLMINTKPVLKRVPDEPDVRELDLQFPDGLSRLWEVPYRAENDLLLGPVVVVVLTMRFYLAPRPIDFQILEQHCDEQGRMSTNLYFWYEGQLPLSMLR